MCADRSDDALETLFEPIAEQLVAWPSDGDVLFLRARHGAALHQVPPSRLICEQEFKPLADALERAGMKTMSLASLNPAQRFALVLILPPRQREEARALLAQAVMRCAPGGRVMACIRNDEGARSGEDDLARIAGTLSTRSRRKCRVYWTAPLQGPADAALAREWATLDAPRPIAEGRFMSRPGVFAWDRIDPASALLAANLPAELSGHAADLGAGYGYLTAELLARCPRITAVDLYEAQSRALGVATTNLKGARVPLEFFWHDVTAGLPRRYDTIISNPPFHAQGREERPDVGRRFIATAAQSLNPAGRLWLVANRHLPYERALDEHFGEIRTVAQEGGFKIIEARGARKLS